MKTYEEDVKIYKDIENSQGQEAFFFNDTATTEIYTLHIVGSVRCV